MPTPAGKKKGRKNDIPLSKEDIRGLFSHPRKLFAAMAGYSTKDILNKLAYILAALAQEKPLPSQTVTTSLVKEVWAEFFAVLTAPENESVFGGYDPSPDIRLLLSSILNLFQTASYLKQSHLIDSAQINILLAALSKNNSDLLAKVIAFDNMTELVPIIDATIDTRYIHTLFEIFSNNSATTAKQVRKIIWRSAELAQQGCLTGRIDTIYIDRLIENIWKNKVIVVSEMAGILKNIVTLAEEDRLFDQVDPIYLERIIKQIIENPVDVPAPANELENFLWHIVQLLQYNTLPMKVDPSFIHFIFNKISQAASFSAAQIRKVLLSIVQLVEIEFPDGTMGLSGKIDAAHINVLFEKALADSEAPVDEIIDILWNVLQLAEKDCLTNQIDAQHINQLLKKIILRNSPTLYENLNTVLWDAIRLAEKNRLSRDQLDSGIINQLFQGISLKTPISGQQLTRLLMQTTTLAIRTEAVIDTQGLDCVLNKALAGETTALKDLQDILCMIKDLAEAKCLSHMPSLRDDYFERLFDRILISNTATAQDLCHALYNARIIINEGHLSRPLNAICINRLLKKALDTPTTDDNPAITGAQCCLLLRDISFLVQHDKLDGEVSIAHLSGILNKISENEPVEIKRVAQALYYIGVLNLHSKNSPQFQKALAPIVTKLRALFDHAEDASYLARTKVAQFLSMTGQPIPPELADSLRGDPKRPRPDAFQLNLAKQLHGSRGDCRVEEFVEGWFADLFIPDPSGKCKGFIIETDGNMHYPANTLRPKDRDRDRVLREKGYRILRLRHGEIRPETQVKMLDAISAFIQGGKDYEIIDCRPIPLPLLKQKRSSAPQVSPGRSTSSFHYPKTREDSPPRLDIKHRPGNSSADGRSGDPYKQRPQSNKDEMNDFAPKDQHDSDSDEEGHNHIRPGEPVSREWGDYGPTRPGRGDSGGSRHYHPYR